MVKNQILFLVVIMCFTILLQPSFATDIPKANLVDFIPGVIYDSVVQGNYAYVANGSGLCVLDISSSQKPRLVSKIQFDYMAYKIKLSGNYAYLACGYAGLMVIDISNPLNPQKRGNFNNSGFYKDLAVSGNKVYLSAGWGGMEIVDVTDPGNMTLLNAYNASHFVDCLTFDHNTAYLGVSSHGIIIVDCTSTANLVKLGEDTTRIYIKELTLVGQYLYAAAESDGLVIYDIKTASTIHSVGHTSGIYGAIGVTMNGLYDAFVSCDNYGLNLVDVSDVTNPVLLSSFDSPGYATHCYVVSSTVYLADAVNGYRILNVDPANEFTETGYYFSSGKMQSITIKDNYAYTAHNGFGFAVYDISSVKNIHPVSGFRFDYGINDVAIDSTFAYLLQGNWLYVANISNPLNPYMVGTCSFDYSYRINVQRPYAFTASYAKGFDIISIETATEPYLISSNTTLKSVQDLKASGNFLYVADETTGLHIINIQMIDIPVEVGYCSVTGRVMGIDVAGNYAYMACTNMGLQVIDITNKTAPVRVGICTTGTTWYDHVRINGHYAFLSNTWNGTDVIDITNPAAPVLIGVCKSPGQSKDVDTKGNNLLIAQDEGGLSVMSFSPIVDFYADVTTGRMPLSVKFNNTSNLSGTNPQYLWYFGDGKTSPLKNPVHTYLKSGYYNVTLVVSDSLGVSSTVHQKYIAVTTGVIPSLKLFTGQHINYALYLSDYLDSNKPNVYSIASNFLSLTQLSGETVGQNSYSTATMGSVYFKAVNSDATTLSSNKVKYTTYKIAKLPKIGLRPNQSIDFPIAAYTYNSTGLAIPPSYGLANSLAFSNYNQFTAIWIGNSIVRVTTFASFSTPVYLDISAADAKTDKERLEIYPNLLTGGTFSAAADTTDFVYQTVADRAALPGNMYYVASRADAAGTVANGIYAFGITASNQGLKATAKLTSFLKYDTNTWYTARMRLFSTATGNDLQALLYNYKGVIPGDAHINGAANVWFGVSTVWSWLEAPLYTTESGTGYPQFQFKSGTNTPTGVIYVDEVQVIKATPSLMDSGRYLKKFKYPYSHFDAVSTFALGWATTQTYMGSSATPAMIVMNGELLLNFTGASSGNRQVAAKYTALSGDSIKCGKYRGGSPGI